MADSFQPLARNPIFVGGSRRRSSTSRYSVDRAMPSFTAAAAGRRILSVTCCTKLSLASDARTLRDGLLLKHTEGDGPVSRGKGSDD